MIQQLILWVYTEGKEITMLERYLHPYAYSSIIYSSEEMRKI